MVRGPEVADRSIGFETTYKYYAERWRMIQRLGPDGRRVSTTFMNGSMPLRLTRRQALARLAVVGFAARAHGQGRSAPTLPWSDLPAPSDTAERIRFTDLSEIEHSIVPNEAFFVLQHGPIPELDGARWGLQISAELTMSLDELRALPRVESVVCFECAGNAGVGRHGLVGNAAWAGVRLRTVLERAGVGDGAREVVFYGADRASERLRGNDYPARFARSLPIADAMDDGVLLAYEMNGEPLPVEHGAPLRLIVPGWYGIAQVKWLARIDVIDHRFMGKYMAKEYVTIQGREILGGIEHRATSVGRQKLKSLVTRVTRAADARFNIHGFAWSDGTPIESVEVSIDDGAFREAELTPSSSRYAWTPFRLEWRNVAPGRHRLVSRARDPRGLQPTAEEASRYKATPWENNGQVVRQIEIPAHD